MITLATANEEDDDEEDYTSTQQNPEAISVKCHRGYEGVGWMEIRGHAIDTEVRGTKISVYIIMITYLTKAAQYSPDSHWRWLNPQVAAWRVQVVNTIVSECGQSAEKQKSKISPFITKKEEKNFILFFSRLIQKKRIVIKLCNDYLIKKVLPRSGKKL